MTKTVARQMNACRKTWYAVGLSCDLDRAPTRVMVLGDPYVIYRSQSGVAVAQLDRCPHRNVPLSAGKCRSDDTIECPYHGWKFAPDGACVKIPGSPAKPKATQRVETFATCEKYGLVWMSPAPEGQRPSAEPLIIPEATDRAYTTMTRQTSYPGGVHAVVENALDVPHTAILHQGLFRSDEARREVDIVLRRHKTWAEAEYVGESPPSGVMGRLLTLGSRGGSKEITLQHWDRFLLPSVLQVEYRIGQGSHFLISGFCTPQDENTTALFAVVCLRTPLPQFIERLLVRIIEPFAWKVVRQDVEVLKAQTETVTHFGGERFMSTDLDVLGTPIKRLLKDAVEREMAGDGKTPQVTELDRSEEPREVTRLKILV